MDEVVQIILTLEFLLSKIAVENNINPVYWLIDKVVNIHFHPEKPLY